MKNSEGFVEFKEDEPLTAVDMNFLLQKAHIVHSFNADNVLQSEQLVTLKTDKICLTKRNN